MEQSKFSVKVTPIASEDLDSIYTYISNELFNENAANNVLSQIESSILSPSSPQWFCWGTATFSHHIFMHKYTILFPCPKKHGIPPILPKSEYHSILNRRISA